MNPTLNNIGNNNKDALFVLGVVVLGWLMTHVAMFAAKLRSKVTLVGWKCADEEMPVKSNKRIISDCN